VAGPGPHSDRTAAGPRLGEGGLPGPVHGLAGEEEAEDDERDADDRGEGARSDDVRGLLDGERRDVVDRADDGDGAAADEIGAVSGYLLVLSLVPYPHSSTVFAASPTKS